MSVIVDCCPALDVPGGYEFNTQWDGFGQTHAACERASAFMPGYIQCFIDLLKRSKIDL